jgi:lipopolysaccharide export system permease protein
MAYLLSTLNLYFCRIFSLWLGFCTLVLGIIISLFEGTELVRRSMGKTSVDFSIILEMLLLKLPGHFQMLLPFIVLSSAMITFYRLNQTREIIAAKSSGLYIWQLMGGLCVFIAAFGGINLLVVNPLSAVMSGRFNNLEAFYFSGNRSQMAVSETGLWFKENMATRQSIVRTNHVQAHTKAFSKVTFHNFDPHKGIYQSRIDADSAILQKGYWELHNVSLWQDKGNQFKSYDCLKIPTSLTIEKIQDSNASPETISFWSLPKFIHILEKSGLSSMGYRLYWHSQLAKIGMMVAMILLAGGLGSRPVRQGKTARYIAFSVGSGFILYFVNDIVYAMGLGGQIPLLLAAWIPTLVVLMLSVTLLLHFEEG